MKRETYAVLPLLAPAGILLWLGRDARPMADDFCSAGLVRVHGLVGAQAVLYATWSGRFTATAAMSLAAWAGPGWYGPVLWLLVAAWLAALLHLIPTPLVACGVALACLAGAPALAQVLYWQTGLLTYVLPIMLLTLALALVRGPFVWWRGALVALLGFLAAGCHESAVVLAVLGSLALALLPSWRAQRPLPLLLASGAGAGGMLVLAAPGNAVRAAYSPQHLSPFLATAHASLQVLGLSVHLVPLLLAVALVAALQAPRSRMHTVSTGRSLLAGALLAVGTLAPAWYGMAGPPPERALWFPCVVLVATAAWCGWHRPVRLPGHIARWAAPALAGLCLLTVSPQLDAWSASAPAYAASWAYLDRTLRADQQPALARLTPTPAGLDDVRPEPTWWVNGCIANAYGRTMVAPF